MVAVRSISMLRVSSFMVWYAALDQQVAGFLQEQAISYNNLSPSRISPSSSSSSLSSPFLSSSSSKLRLVQPTQHDEQQQDGMIYPIQKSDDEWKAILTPDQYYILRKEGTETPGVSPLNQIKAGVDEGTFSCAGCSSPLFVAQHKYESGTGWPSFYQPISNSAITLKTDYKLVLPRTECVCSQCGGHLGHVFEDGPEPTGQRYCMNGAALVYTSDAASPELAEAVKQRQQDDPFKLTPQQVLPSIVVNGLIAAFFLSAFLGGDHSSPVAVLTILPALYYGFLTSKSVAKLM